MEEYASNSHSSKELKREDVPERKKLTRVTSGEVRTRKKSKLATAFLSEDISNIKSYILMEIIVPSIKNVITDVVTNSIEMLLHGDSGRTKRTGTGGSKVPYRKYYDDKNDNRRDYSATTTRTKTGYSFYEVIVSSKGEAEDVLSIMDERIAEYGVVSVADLYELVNIEGDYTDNKYGWTNLRSANSIRVAGGGYLIKLPKAMPLT